MVDFLKRPTFPTLGPSDEEPMSEAAPGTNMASAGPIAPPAPNTGAINVPPVGRVQADQNEVNRLRSTGSGVDQYRKMHPIAGGILKGLNLAGSMVLPGLMAGIPGTDIHHQALEKQAQSNLTSDTAIAAKQADTTESLAKANALAHPKEEKPDNPQLQYIEAYQKAVAEGRNPETDTTVQSLKKAIGDYSDITNKSQPHQVADPKAGYSQAIADAIQSGRDPNTDPHVQAWKQAMESIAKTPTETAAMMDQEYQTIKEKEHAGQPLTPQEKARKQAYEDRKTLGTRTTFTLNEGPREKKEEAGVKQATYKAFAPAMDSAERLNVMTESAEKAVKDHDQQAMLNLLANHLGMTMGLQKGARLNQALISEAQKSMPWLQGLQAHFDKDGYLSGVVLTPQQVQQMVTLGQSRFHEDTVKARNESKYLGATDDGPDRTPSKATMKLYLSQAGGDINKAKQAAIDDGWTVK